MNERAGADREGRREIQNENGQILVGTESMDEQSERGRERERIPNPSYIVYRNNGVSFFIVVQLTFSLESVHQNGRR